MSDHNPDKTETDLDSRLNDLRHFVSETAPLLNNLGSDTIISPDSIRALLPSTEELSQICSSDERRSCVILGDIGMLALTLTRNGIDVEFEYPELVELLEFLSRVTGLPPRDNYYSYTDLNLEGGVYRTYTGSEQEKLLVLKTLEIKRSLATAIIGLRELSTLLLNGDFGGLEQKLFILSNLTKEAFDSLQQIRVGVDPNTFDLRRRILKTPIFLSRTKWEGASTVNSNGRYLIPNNNDTDSSFPIIDAILYPSDDRFATYVRSMYPYFPFSVRNQIEIDLSQTSLFELASMRWDQLGSVEQESLIQIYDTIYMWRAMHNAATTSHLRRFGRGRKQEPEKGFFYDERLYWLQNRSKYFRDGLKLLSKES